MKLFITEKFDSISLIKFFKYLKTFKKCSYSTYFFIKFYKQNLYN